MKCPKHDIEYRIRKLGGGETAKVCSECDRESREKFTKFYKGTPTNEKPKAKP